MKLPACYFLQIPSAPDVRGFYWQIRRQLGKDGPVRPWPALPFLHLPIVRRLLVSVVGGLVGYLLNLLPYTLLTRGLHWSHDAAYAVSLSWLTALMFLWNYRVNFPTRTHWRLCAGRYLATVVVSWLVNFYAVRWGREWLPVSAAIFVVGFVVAVLKFGLYHYWVFPHHPTPDVQA